MEVCHREPYESNVVKKKTMGEVIAREIRITKLKKSANLLAFQVINSKPTL